MLENPSSAPRKRLRAETWPSAVYAVGDVHGCHDALIEMERTIAADATRIAGEKWIVMLGDYVDRGPDSAAVIDHLIGPAPSGLRRICLTGNHEQMMLDFIADPARHAYWLDEGGIETLASYGADVDRLEGHLPIAVPDGLAASVPPEHLRFIATLPIMLALPGWLFVHAGIRPGVRINRQSDEDLIWIREPFLDGPGVRGYRVVHGHTPSDAPEIMRHRIGIDTHCFATGRLTALRVTPGGETRIFTVQT
jgi:serine/threonine protein phosphatase 1